MITKTTFRLSLTRWQFAIGHIRAYLAQRDPLALAAVLAIIPLIALGMGVSAWRAAAPAPQAAPPVLAPARSIIVMATAQPTSTPTATVADPALAALQATVQAQQEQLAALEKQLSAQQEQQPPAPAQAAQEAPQQAPAAETTYQTSSAPEQAPAITDDCCGPSDWQPTGRASDEEIARLRAAMIAAGQASIDRQRAAAQDVQP